MADMLVSLRMFVGLSLLTGLLYPMVITLVSQGLWPEKASGSLILKRHKVIGSDLIGQKFTSTKYFHSRPSAVDYATIPSGASNWGATNKKFQDSVKSQIGKDLPPDLVTSSGSGLDPHISPEAARVQMDSVSAARQLTPSQRGRLNELVQSQVVRTLGGMGPNVIHVLSLNLALDKEFPLHEP